MMILEQSSEASRQDALDPKRAMPSKHTISSLGSLTNGFLFSTTPIIIRILKELCSDFDEATTSFIASGWLYGSIIGILLFGFIGDVLGYYKGMIMATAFTFIGMISGVISLWTSSSWLPFLFGISRILLGIGCGGSIPIAYTRTSDSNTQEVSSTGSILLLLQSSSWLLGPVLFNLCLKAFPSSLPSVLQGILVVASLPSFLSLLLLCYSYHQVVYLPLVDVEEARTKPKGEPTFPVWRAFLASGITWFLYDFNSYGNTFSSKDIVRNMVPIPDSPAGVTIPLILAGLFGVPGQFMVHSLFRRFDVRSVQRIGFAILSFLFIFVAIGLRHHMPSFITFILYHLTFFFSTCGPGSTTYILPSLLFDEHRLSLFHGICTCMGKLGGALGASLFPQLVSRFGASPAMFLCCALSFISCILSFIVC